MLDDTTLQHAAIRLDGRRARTQRTRQRLIEAYLGLLRSAQTMPTAADIAKRAGYHVRSLFERFPSGADLNAAAAKHLMAQEAAEPTAPAGPDRPSRTEHWVRGNLGACERWWPLWRAHLLAPERAECLAWTFEDRRMRRIGELEAAFRPELTTLPQADGARIVIALEVMTSVESWGQLKHRHGQSDAAIRDIWVATMDRLLPEGPPLPLPLQAA